MITLGLGAEIDDSWQNQGCGWAPLYRNLNSPYGCFCGPGMVSSDESRCSGPKPQPKGLMTPTVTPPVSQMLPVPVAPPTTLTRCQVAYGQDWIEAASRSSGCDSGGYGQYACAQAMGPIDSCRNWRTQATKPLPAQTPTIDPPPNIVPEEGEQPGTGTTAQTLKRPISTGTVVTLALGAGGLAALLFGKKALGVSMLGGSALAYLVASGNIGFH